jgi:hypothetical protein
MPRPLPPSRGLPATITVLGCSDEGFAGPDVGDRSA